MNEQAQQLINEAGEKVLEYLEATEGFAVEQAPLLAQEIVRYGMVKYGFLSLMGMALTLFGLSGIRWAIKSCGDRDEVTEAEGVSFCVGLLIGIGGAVVVVLSGLQFIKALAAPRLYIIEQIGGLI